jgi:DNA repair protein RadC
MEIGGACLVFLFYTPFSTVKASARTFGPCSRAPSAALTVCAAACDSALGQSRPRFKTESIMKTERTLLICDAGSGTLREATGDELLDLAREYISRRIRRGASLTSPRATRDYLTLRFGMREHEVFCVIHLDKRNRMIDCQELFRGTIDGASVHPREIVKEALQRNSAACILVHNHPSGVAEPSQADEIITERVKAALALVDIRVLDHLIVAGGEVVSMAERGVM